MAKPGPKGKGPRAQLHLGVPPVIVAAIDDLVAESAYKTRSDYLVELLARHVGQLDLIPKTSRPQREALDIPA
jgi:Arc/MetJ-type ribon-helix-helix transcriptional regulator